MWNFHRSAWALGSLLFGCQALAATPLATPLVHSGVNDVQFGAANHQPQLGNGFVVQFQGRYFGVTAKHVLLMAQDTGGPGTALPAATQWVLRNQAEPAARQVFGQVLNGDAGEARDLQLLQKDTLVFELPAAPAGFQVLQLASRDVAVGDELTAFGCTYQAGTDCREQQYRGTVVELTAPHLLVDLGHTDLQSLFGLSGAPVLNQAGELVGLVSQFLPDKQGVQRAAHFDLTYLRQVLKQAAAAK